jgi:hypothetical protein
LCNIVLHNLWVGVGRGEGMYLKLRAHNPESPENRLENRRPSGRSREHPTLNIESFLTLINAVERVKQLATVSARFDIRLVNRNAD